MRLVPLAAALAFSLFLAAGAHAAGIEVKGAWIRATPPGATTAAGYLTLVNHGPTSDRLTGGHTGAAASLEVHQMSTAGGIMRMRPLPSGLAIGAGAAAALPPNGTHLMLIGLKRPLTPGEHVKAVLDFTRAGPVTVDFEVRAAPPGAGMPGMKM